MQGALPGGLLAALFCLLSLSCTDAARSGDSFIEGVRSLAWEKDFGSGKPAGGPPTPLPGVDPSWVHQLPEVLSVEDALEWKGQWILLERRLGRIHILHKEQGLLSTMGRRGLGPGEPGLPLVLSRIRVHGLRAEKILQVRPR